MKKITTILKTLITIFFFFNLSTAVFADAIGGGVIIVGCGDPDGEENGEGTRQLDKLIKGEIKDKKVEFQFDPSLGNANVTVKNNNSVIKQTAVNSSLRSDLEFSLDELGTGDIRIDFVDQEGNSAYATFTVH